MRASGFSKLAIAFFAGTVMLILVMSGSRHGASRYPVQEPGDEAATLPPSRAPSRRPPSPIDRGSTSTSALQRDSDWRESANADWVRGNHADAIERWKSVADSSAVKPSEKRDAADHLMVGLLSARQGEEATRALLKALAAECACEDARPMTTDGKYSIWFQDCHIGEVESLRDRVMVALEDLGLWEPAGSGPIAWVSGRLDGLEATLGSDAESLAMLRSISEFLSIAAVFGPPSMESTTERALARARPMVSEFLHRTEMSPDPAIHEMRAWLAKRFEK